MSCRDTKNEETQEQNKRMKDIEDRKKGYENALAWEDDESQGKRGTEAGSSQVKNDHSFPPLSSRGGLTLGATARTTCSEMVLLL